MTKKIGKKNSQDQMTEILEGIQSESRVQEMKNYIQHGRTTTYEHCENVARLSCAIDRKLSLGSDINALVTGAMLHDFFLYDWHDSELSLESLHGFHHPKIASQNARKYLDVDDRTSHVIDTHMWPFTITKIPLSREAWIVCVADKAVSLYETIFRR